MTNRCKIQWLKRYTVLERRIKRKFDKVEQLRAGLGKVTSALSLAPAGGGSIHKLGDYDAINRLVDIVVEWEAEINIWCDMEVEIRTVIDAVEDPREQELLEMRYIYGMTFEVIASNLSYSWRHVHRLHSAALDKVRLPCKGDQIKEVEASLTV